MPPKDGITILAHAQEALTHAEAVVLDTRLRVGAYAWRRRVPKQEREELSRALAGAIGNLELVRLWLNAGAPL